MELRRLAQGYEWVRERLFAPVDVVGLAYFRVVFGLIMLWEVYRYFDRGWIARYWIDPEFNFTYYGFDWVRPLPGHGMYWLFIGLGILAALIAVGLWYRVSATLFFLGFTYMFLLEQARYLNHFYLIILISFLLIFLPAHRAFSLDAWRRPELAANLVPAWTWLLLQFQLGAVYFFGGVAKINGDWLRGEPMRMWLARRPDFPLVGGLSTEEWVVYLFSYGGLLFDLLIAPLLIWRRTRPFAIAAVIFFHLTNDNLFTIGIFPWFMIAATPIFFEPDWLPRTFKRLSARAVAARYRPPSPQRKHLIVSLVGLYVAVQCLLPMRHWLYTGDPNWTEEGHRFSWHMKLRSKSGRVLFTIHDPASGTLWEVNPRDRLPGWQESKMATRPDMILQFAHYLAEEKRREGYESVAVYADARVSLNGRSRQPLIDYTLDLTTQKRSLWPTTWIRPLTEPLPRR
jgi:hypothetical protein